VFYRTAPISITLSDPDQRFIVYPQKVDVALKKGGRYVVCKLKRPPLCILLLLFFITPYTAAHKHTNTKKLKYI